EEAAARARHAGHYLGLAQSSKLAQLERERDNFRAALRWFEESGDVTSGARLMVALGQLWVQHGPLGEGKGWLARFRALPGFAEAPPEVRALALMAESQVELRRDAMATRALGEELLALGRAGNRAWMERAMVDLSWSSLELGELSRADRELAERLALAKEM